MCGEYWSWPEDAFLFGNAFVKSVIYHFLMPTFHMVKLSPKLVTIPDFVVTNQTKKLALNEKLIRLCIST